MPGSGPAAKLGRMVREESPRGWLPEVDPEDLTKYGDAALRMVDGLSRGESVRWANLVNTAASMADVDEHHD